jgi:hypothetical protein
MTLAPATRRDGDIAAIARSHAPSRRATVRGGVAAGSAGRP